MSLFLGIPDQSGTTGDTLHTPSQATTAYAADTNATAWETHQFDLLLNINTLATQTSASIDRNHRILVERVDIVIGLVISILGILSLKLAVFQFAESIQKFHMKRNSDTTATNQRGEL